LSIYILSYSERARAKLHTETETVLTVEEETCAEALIKKIFLGRRKSGKERIANSEALAGTRDEVSGMPNPGDSGSSFSWDIMILKSQLRGPSKNGAANT